MQNAITTLRIRNFKSIKDVTLNPRRVNLIIGEPNVGKSNVLEAMSLLGGMVYEQNDKFMSDFIRYERPSQMFYDEKLDDLIGIATDHKRCYLGFEQHRQNFKAVYASNSTWAYAYDEQRKYSTYSKEDATEHNLRWRTFRGIDVDDFLTLGTRGTEYAITRFDTNGKLIINSESEHVTIFGNINSINSTKYYLFLKGKEVGRNYGFSFLNPPHGDNLKFIIQNHSPLRKEIAQLFAHYGQKLMLRMASNELEVTKEVDELIYSVPYSSTADTLQRLIFYLAAIESNDDAVILFEEPEAHSYPVYVAQLGRRIAQSRNNQFFVATHSPYLITEILETMLPDEEQAQELAIFVAYYEDYQTKLRQLTDDEVRSIRADGLDVFYNMDRLAHPQA